MMRFLVASAVLAAGSYFVKPAQADHGFYGGRAYYPPGYCAPAYRPYHQVRRNPYSPYRVSPYAVHNRYRNYHHSRYGYYGGGYGYGGARGGVSLYGPRGGFSIRF